MLLLRRHRDALQRARSAIGPHPTRLGDTGLGPRLLVAAVDHGVQRRLHRLDAIDQQLEHVHRRQRARSVLGQQSTSREIGQLGVSHEHIMGHRRRP
jgi:hypothetical protein